MGDNPGTMDRPRGIAVPNLGRLAGPPGAKSPAWRLLNAGTDLNVWLYRRSGGWIGGRMGRAPVLLLHHVGRKSGRRRVAPVLYLADGDRLVIVASKGGSHTNPAWFGNLMAHPNTTVEVGRSRRDVVAREATEEERRRYWPRLLEIYPSYGVYQQRTRRAIPIVVLEPPTTRQDQA
jgi:deazaflavin-dependent oxidoreductase (nitroreductase family)